MRMASPKLPTKKFITELAKEGGLIARNNFYKKKSVEYKIGYDAVTNIDRKIEKFLTKKIRAKFPDHQIIGEELEHREMDSDYKWILDPIDGTNNFVQGVPHYSTVLCLLHKDEPVITAVYEPNKDNLFFAQKGKGMFVNGKKQKVGTKKKLDQAMMGFTANPYHYSPKVLKLMKNFFRIRAIESISLDLAYVACGWLDGRVKLTKGQYDIAGGILMVREASGQVLDLKGKQWSYKSNSGFVASNKFLIKKILQKIQ